MTDEDIVIDRLLRIREQLPPEERNLPVIASLGSTYTIDEMVTEIRKKSATGKGYTQTELKRLKAHR